MSYEGYEQHICANGHRFDEPCSYGNQEEARCTCGELSVWVNYVDDTNCDAVGVIPSEEWVRFKLTEARGERCNLGHWHTTAEETFRVPTDAEKLAAQHYWDGEKHIKLNRPIP